MVNVFAPGLLFLRTAIRKFRVLHLKIKKNYHQGTNFCGYLIFRVLIIANDPLGKDLRVSILMNLLFFFFFDGLQPVVVGGIG